MDKRPLVSIVIPTYNRIHQTIAAVESALAQTYPNCEIIVVDDSSTDESGKQIERFLSERAVPDGQPQEIQYFRQPNQGSSVARNTGIEKSRGEYVAFLDSDDVWMPEKIEWQVRAIEQFRDNCGACFTDTELVNNTGIETAFQTWGRHYEQTTGIEHKAPQLLARSVCGLWVSTLLVRTDLIKQIGGFDPAISFCEDRDMYFRLSRVTSLAYVNKVLARIDRLSQSNDAVVRPWHHVEVRLRGNVNMLEKWLRTDKTLPPDLRKAAARNLREIHSQWTNWYLETKRYDEARQSVSKAIKCELTPGLTVKWALTWVAPTFARKMTAKARPYL